MPKVAPIRPRILPRSSAGKTSPTTAPAVGVIPPVLTPWMARPTSTMPKFGAMAISSEPTANPAMLIR